MLLSLGFDAFLVFVYLFSRALAKQKPSVCAPVGGGVRTELIIDLNLELTCRPFHAPNGLLFFTHTKEGRFTAPES